MKHLKTFLIALPLLWSCTVDESDQDNSSSDKNNEQVVADLGTPSMDASSTTTTSEPLETFVPLQDGACPPDYTVVSATKYNPERGCFDSSQVEPLYCTSIKSFNNALRCAVDPKSQTSYMFGAHNIVDTRTWKDCDKSTPGYQAFYCR